MSRGTRRRCEKRGRLVSQETVVMSVHLGSNHRLLKQYYMEILLISFHFNGHTPGVHFCTTKLEYHITVPNSVHLNSGLASLGFIH